MVKSKPTSTNSIDSSSSRQKAELQAQMSYISQVQNDLPSEEWLGTFSASDIYLLPMGGNSTHPSDKWSAIRITVQRDVVPTKSGRTEKLLAQLEELDSEDLEGVKVWALSSTCPSVMFVPAQGAVPAREQRDRQLQNLDLRDDTLRQLLDTVPAESNVVQEFEAMREEVWKAQIVCRAWNRALVMKRRSRYGGRPLRELLKGQLEVEKRRVEGSLYSLEEGEGTSV